MGSCNRLLNEKKCFHLKQFSATDYIHASALLAREMPDLLESKIILMYRDPLPDRLVQRREMFACTLKNNDSRHTILSCIHRGGFAIIAALVFFSSLDFYIQRVVVYAASALCFVVFGTILLYVPFATFALLLLVFVSTFLIGPLVYVGISRAFFKK